MALIFSRPLMLLGDTIADLPANLPTYYIGEFFLDKATGIVYVSLPNPAPPGPPVWVPVGATLPDDLAVGGDLTVAGTTTLTGLLTANGNVELGNAITDTVDVNGNLRKTSLNTSGTPGPATANTQTGRSALAIGASSVVITNSLVTAASNVQAQMAQFPLDATATSIIATVPGAGSFTVHFNAVATAATVFNWEVNNPTA